MTWSILDTKARIAKRFGASHLDRVASSFYAMGQRQTYARYHFREIKRLTRQFERGHLHDKDLMLVSLGGDSSGRQAFEDYLVKAGSHSIACVLCIHSIADVSAFAIYEALGLSLKNPPLISAHRVSASLLEPVLRAAPGLATLADVLARLLEDSSYKHVVALANHSKHRGLIKPSLNEDWTGRRSERLELRFSAVAGFPECDIPTLLQPAYAAASAAVVDIGNEINAQLA